MVGKDRTRRKLTFDADIERPNWFGSGRQIPVRLAPEQRLSWSEVARLVILVARVRLLDLRLSALAARGADFRDARLLRLSRRWLAAHEAIGRLLPGMPEPESVGQVRAILAGGGPGHRNGRLRTPRAVIASGRMGAGDLMRGLHRRRPNRI